MKESMDTQYQITRCPMCGGVNLQAGYDYAADVAGGREFTSAGIMGALKGLLWGKGDNGKYWVCQKCGHQFPMV